MGLTGRMARGLIAGVAGTVAMDLLWWQRSRRDGADDTFLEWEFTEVESFADAGAPPRSAGGLPKPSASRSRARRPGPPPTSCTG